MHSAVIPPYGKSNTQAKGVSNGACYVRAWIYGRNDGRNGYSDILPQGIINDDSYSSLYGDLYLSSSLDLVSY